MKNVVMLTLLASALTSSAIAQTEAPSLADLTTGSVVRVSARQPLVTLGHAEVVGFSSNEVVVSQSKRTYTIQTTNLLDLVLLERAEPPPPAAGAPGATESRTGAKGAAQAGKGPLDGSMLSALWQKITSLWR